MPKTPVMSTIKNWYQEKVMPDEPALGYLLTGFSLGVWMGSLHPEIKEKLEDEMPDQIIAHNELTERLITELRS